MMSQRSDVEVADQLSRRRARVLPILALVFLSQQAAYVTDPVEGAGESLRTVDHVRIGAWLVMSVALLLLLTTVSWFKSRNVRALLDDEVTRANRAASMQLGFIVTMVAAIVIYPLNQFEPLTARDAIHLLVTIGIATALVRFGMLERRGHLGD